MKTWYIGSMQCAPKENEMIDVVKVVNWSRVYQKDINGKTYTQRIIGVQNFPLPEESSFIPYDQLTFDQVCEWLDSTVNVSEIDAQLDVMMEQAINPPVIELPLPWGS